MKNIQINSENFCKKKQKKAANMQKKNQKKYFKTVISAYFS